ncbi:HlyD family secretion protein [Sphingomonas profundi]|uniref:HlyD family secretion protein n=1 Tax=Alterirhizorhabdus profundi TaxID=2681549 RepID=UPI0012E7E70D|nr:HlyD family secretion protein [Sphingomonas profundi]
MTEDDDRKTDEHEASDGEPAEQADGKKSGDGDKDAKKRRDRGDDKDGDDEDGGEKNDDAEDDDEEDEDDKKDKGPPLYKRPVFWIVGGIVLVILIVGGVLWWLHARRFQSTDDAFIDAHIVRIAAQTSGRVIYVAPSDNRHVRIGQLLAAIEPGTPAASRLEAVAGVSQADAAIAQAQARVLSARATRRQAAANALAPEADARRAARDYARYLDLLRRDALAAAATQVDQARAQAESTAAQALAARRQVQTAAADVLAAAKEVDAARAQRAAAVARVRQADVTLSYLRIQAPLNGQVVNRQVNVGSYLAPGQQLMAIVPDQMWVTANFKETQLEHMRRGQHVDIEVDAYPGVRFSGHVDSIQRGAGQAFALLPPQNATGNYVKVVQRVPVRIVFDRVYSKRYVLGPGMSVVPRVTVR